MNTLLKNSNNFGKRSLKTAEIRSTLLPHSLVARIEVNSFCSSGRGRIRPSLHLVVPRDGAYPQLPLPSPPYWKSCASYYVEFK
ncbi:hypothetical protein E2C01_041078 [Portunus trituberculatus]|uniref:Uncharacterized protein n=1 Tax=Portunus trituberculatus TaxID=210409 RepID=A0A5B7FPF2_PORTR|nr:hypothetical protein [Portunus trituberculatus]